MVSPSLSSGRDLGFNNRCSTAINFQFHCISKNNVYFSIYYKYEMPECYRFIELLRRPGPFPLHWMINIYISSARKVGNIRGRFTYPGVAMAAKARMLLHFILCTVEAGRYVGRPPHPMNAHIPDAEQAAGVSRLLYDDTMRTPVCRCVDAAWFGMVAGSFSVSIVPAGMEQAVF